MKKSAALIFISIFALAFTLGFVTAPSLVAHAADAEAYIMGSVSDLKNNSAAGASPIAVKDYDTGNVLFYLPESYYVKVISKNTALDIYRVEYAGLTNLYIDASATVKEPEAVSFAANVSPYPNMLLQLPENGGFTLSGTNIDSTYTIKFLGFKGDNKDENIYVTASKNDTTLQGAVPKSAFTAFSLPYHPITEAERQALITPPPSGGEDGQLAPKSSETLRIILIIGIIVPAVLIVFLLFKPTKDGKNNYDKRAIKHKRANDYDYDRDRRYDADKSYDRDRYDRDYRGDGGSRYDERGYDRPYRDERDFRGGSRDYDDRRRYDK